MIAIELDPDQFIASSPKIGYNNLLSSSTTTDAKKALIPNTWERWRPSGTFSAKFQLGSASEVDYFAIGGHALSGETILIKTAATVGGALTDWEVINFADNKAKMILLPARTIAEIEISGTLSAANEIAYISVGKALSMPYPIYGNHSPIHFQEDTEFQNNISDTGQFLGRNIIRQGAESSFEFENLKDDFVRGEFSAFIQSAKTKPFFIRWRPDLYDETALCYALDDIKPKNTANRRMSVSIKARAHNDV